MEKAENIVLIGFMGSGKSAISREISRLLGFSCIDTDQQIAEQQKMSIQEIFDKHGEAHFRTLECDLLEKIVKNNVTNSIISTGGGMPTTSDSRNLIKNLGYVIWLSASIEETLNRVQFSPKRPLLQVTDPLKMIRKLINEREPYYQEASDFRIDTTSLTINEVAGGIVNSASYYFSRKKTL